MDGTPLMRADGTPLMKSDGTPIMGTAGDPCCCGNSTPTPPPGPCLNGCTLAQQYTITITDVSACDCPNPSGYKMTGTPNGTYTLNYVGTVVIANYAFPFAYIAAAPDFTMTRCSDGLQFTGGLIVLYIKPPDDEDIPCVFNLLVFIPTGDDVYAMMDAFDQFAIYLCPPWTVPNGFTNCSTVYNIGYGGNATVTPA